MENVVDVYKEFAKKIVDTNFEVMQMYKKLEEESKNVPKYPSSLKHYTNKISNVLHDLNVSLLWHEKLKNYLEVKGLKKIDMGYMFASKEHNIKVFPKSKTYTEKNVHKTLIEYLDTPNKDTEFIFNFYDKENWECIKNEIVIGKDLLKKIDELEDIDNTLELYKSMRINFDDDLAF